MAHDIIAIIPVYNDIDGFKRLYDNLHNRGINMIVGDGRFPLFETIDSNDNSTDGLDKFCYGKSDIILQEYGLMTLPEKLSSMMKLAGEIGYKYTILFGADEIPHGDFEMLVDMLDNKEEKPDLYRVKFSTGDPNTHSANFVERVVRYPHRVSVRNSHYMYFREGEDTPIISDEITIPGVSIIHDKTIRDNIRDNMMTTYQTKRIGQEKGSMHAYYKGVDDKPTLLSLQKLYPGHEISEDISAQGKKVFKILDRTGFRTQPSRLVSNWVRMRERDGLVVVE